VVGRPRAAPSRCRGHRTAGSAGRRSPSSRSGGRPRARRRRRRGSTRRTAEVAPVFVLLEPRFRRRPGADRLVAQERRDQPSGDLTRHLEQRHLGARAGGALDPERVAVVGWCCSRARMIIRFTGNHTGPRQFELPTEHAAGRLGRLVPHRSWPPRGTRTGGRGASATASGCRTDRGTGPRRACGRGCGAACSRRRARGSDGRSTPGTRGPGCPRASPRCASIRSATARAARGNRSSVSSSNTVVAHSGSSPTNERTFNRVPVPSGSRSTS
jgi:hypothetical protein